MSYSKKKQLKKNKREAKVCSKCKRRRLIKFFEKETSRVCDECKRRSKRLKKQSSKGYIEKKLDTKWSEQVKIKAGYKCEICGTRENLNSHHIFSRSNKAVRHDVENGCCLCAKHHLFDLKLSAHKAPVEFLEIIREKRGEKWYNKLRQKAKILST
ncbi:MAG: hypothetical protein WC280_02445 [Patescibacteria group bacterium]